MERTVKVADVSIEGEKIDHRSGEVSQTKNEFDLMPKIEGTHNAIIRDKFYFGKEFVTMFKEDLFWLVVEGELKFNDLRVFLYLCSTLDRDNIVVTNREVIATHLKLPKDRVSNIITRLKKRNLVVEHKFTGQHGPGPRPVLYAVQLAQLNCNVVYNGQIKDYKNTIKNYPNVTKEDGITLLDPDKEKARKEALEAKKKAELEAKKAQDLFPETFPSE